MSAVNAREKFLAVMRFDTSVSPPLYETGYWVGRIAGWYEEGLPKIQVSCERLGAAMNLSNLYLKDETRNPPGSFKDGPISCAISKTKEEGKNTVITSTFLNPFASEGDKTVAYELYQQLRLAPDWIVVPVGQGLCWQEFTRDTRSLNSWGW